MGGWIFLIHDSVREATLTRGQPAGRIRISMHASAREAT